MINKELGGLNFAKCILYSFNYGEINALNKLGDWRGVYNLMLEAAGKLEYAGAECLLLCANTLHQFADELASKVSVPLINIAEATAKEINNRKYSKVGLLGTRITMEAEFYKNKLNQKNISVVVPPKDDRDFIHETILTELLKSIILEKSKSRFLRIMNDLRDEGAEAIILGCTEIPLIIKQEDTDLPLIDTLQIHCQAAVRYALSGT
jgi:aspartate racemase